MRVDTGHKRWVVVTITYGAIGGSCGGHACIAVVAREVATQGVVLGNATATTCSDVPEGEVVVVGGVDGKAQCAALFDAKDIPNGVYFARDHAILVGF